MRLEYCYKSFFCAVFVISVFLFAAECSQDHGFANARFSQEGKKNWLWAKQVGGQGSTYGVDVAVDQEGNAYVVGFLSGTTGFLAISPGASNFDGQIFKHRSEMDMFIAKYRPNGTIVWIRQIGETGHSSAQSIAIGKDGNVYITGDIERGILEPIAGSARIDSFVLSSNDSCDMYIIAMNPSGEALWVTQPGSSGEVSGEGIAVDSIGNCYVTGILKGRFGNTNVVNTGKEDIFIAKYNKRGHFQWVRTIGGPSKDEGLDIAVDRQGSCYVTGFFEKEAKSDTIKGVIRIKHYFFFLAKYDGNGVLQWMRDGLNNGIESRAYGVAVDSERNSYITGGFRGEMVFGSTTLNSLPFTDDPEMLDDVFVAKYDPNGLPIWAGQGGGPKGDMGRGIAVDKAGNCYVTGSFYGNASFGPIKLTGKTSKTGFGDRPVFVAKYDPFGVLKWIEQSKAPSGSEYQSSSGNGIALNRRGDCYLTGFFDIAIQFGSIKLEGFNSQNMFIAKINSR